MSNDGINSNEIPLARQGTDITRGNNQNDTQLRSNYHYGTRQQAADQNGKRTDSTATNLMNNLSHSNLTTVN